MKAIERIAPDVGWLPISFANTYFVGHHGGPWALIDTGLPGRAAQIIEAAEGRFGGGARPEAIYLTHGHFDHAGSTLQLSEHWDVPVFAHRMELAYLTGRSDYPPPDPTIGGAMAFLSRFMPHRSRDLTGWVRELPENALPGLPEWRWIPTPGHSPGHVSYFRPSDRVLLAGDAFATMNMDSWSGLVGGRTKISLACAPFNFDWGMTRQSIRKLADLEPKVAACGHGIPMDSGEFAEQFEAYAAHFRPPHRGRYVDRAAEVTESGVAWLPPAPFDPVPLATAGALLLAGIALGAGYLEEQLRD